MTRTNKQHNKDINSSARKHFERGAVVIVSDISFRGGILYIAMLVLHKDKRFLVSGATTVFPPRENKEIVGACLAMEHFLSKHHRKIPSPDSVVWIIDQGCESFSGKFINLSRRFSEQHVLLKAKSHVCKTHAVCDKVCKMLWNKFPSDRFSGTVFNIEILEDGLPENHLDYLRGVFRFAKKNKK
jgi:hypothetical protein